MLIILYAYIKLAEGFGLRYTNSVTILFDIAKIRRPIRVRNTYIYVKKESSYLLIAIFFFMASEIWRKKGVKPSGITPKSIYAFIFNGQASTDSPKPVLYTR